MEMHAIFISLSHDRHTGRRPAAPILYTVVLYCWKETPRKGGPVFMKILLVEDERPFSDAICHILGKNAYETVAAYDGEQGLDEALSGIYDIILLDIMLPRRNGLEVLRELRRASISTPVLLLTAKGEVEDKVYGLDCGADDYLVKPFAADELLARLRALGRRRGEILDDDAYAFEDVSLAVSTYELTRGTARVRLSKKEFELMKRLLLRAPQLVRKEEMLTKLWGYENAATDNNLEVYISFLRKKLLHLGSGVKIGCVRNVGYQLEAAPCSDS